MDVLRAATRDAYEDLDSRVLALTSESCLYEGCDVVGVVGHVRGSRLDLNEALANVAKFSFDKQGANAIHNVSQVEVYADRLTAQSPVRPPPTCDSLTLITRVPFAGTKPVEIDLSAGSSDFLIELHCGRPAAPIQFNVQFPGGGAVEQAVLDPSTQRKDHRHWVLQFSRGDMRVDSVPSSDSMKELFENSTRSVVDLIQENGTFSQMGWDNYNGHLRRLLNYQLILATKMQDDDRGLAYQIADYVGHLCQGIPKAFDLYGQASVIAASKAVGRAAFMTALVPKLDLSTAQQVLDTRLESAVAFDAAYRDLRTLQANSNNVRLLANVALEKSIDSDKVYSFMSNTAESRLQGAQIAFNKAQREFESLQLELKDRQDAFKKGIEEWKAKKDRELIGNVFTAIAGVVGAIALACAAPPAAAGAVASIGSGAEDIVGAVDSAKKVAGLFDEIKTIADAIKDIYKKIEPYLKKIKEMVDTIQKMVSLVQQKKSMDNFKTKEVEGLKLPSITGDDQINLTADWSIFQLEMDKMHKGIQAESIGGSEEFFLLMAKMVVRGKAIFAAQTALTAASDEYITVIQHRIVQEKHTERLRSAIPKIQGSDESLGIVKLAMAERILAVRSWIVLDFRQYVASYAWNCLSPKQPITVDPMKDIASFRLDAATLQALTAQVPPSVRAQKRTFYLDGRHSALSGVGEFVNDLRNSNSASFTIRCEDDVFQRYGRLRLRSARLYLDGLPAGADEVVSLRLTLGSAMKDLGITKPDESTVKATEVSGEISPRVLQFVTTESVFGFEYRSQGEEILMDGEFMGTQASSLLLSPFRTWTVSVDSPTDLTSVTGVRLVLACEVTYL